MRCWCELKSERAQSVGVVSAMRTTFRICGNESQTGLQLFLAIIEIAFHWKERKNTHEKRTVRYKSQLICIHICHQLFFTPTCRIVSFLQFEPWNQTCSEVVFLSQFFPFLPDSAPFAFGFQFQNKHPFKNSIYALGAFPFFRWGKPRMKLGAVWRRKLLGYRIWLCDLCTGLFVGWGKPFPAPSYLLRPFWLLSLSFIRHNTSKHFVDDHAYFAQ